MFKLIWSLFLRPSVPPPIADEPAMPIAYLDPACNRRYYKLGNKRLHFSSPSQEQLCRLILATGKFPPKHCIGQFRGDEFGLYDRLANAWYPLRSRSAAQYRKVRSIVERNRREQLQSSPHAAIDRDAQ